MFQIRLFSSCFSLYSITFSLSSYADCPNISHFEVQTDGSHIARTEEGIWKQFENTQSYKSANGAVNPLISLFYVSGKDLIYSNNLSNLYDKIVCIYKVENNKYIVLNSPFDQKYIISFSNTPKNSGDWRIIDETNSMCVTDLWINENDKLINKCKFYSL